MAASDAAAGVRRGSGQAVSGFSTGICSGPAAAASTPGAAPDPRPGGTSGAGAGGVGEAPTLGASRSTGGHDRSARAGSTAAGPQGCGASHTVDTLLSSSSMHPARAPSRSLHSSITELPA
ncbi:hypothetical protein MHT86_03710 [Corynebacterium mastitidis]|uniref:hypothetical protein n=1 Tax=Corynebacterium mastitidis TaxID=161890 RepID=UPI0012FE8306|nr:hypothetical protein [Corynebacterium mastitidis]MCH6196604.1 hypothetical protein [Corynebacterium mastitidis]